MYKRKKNSNIWFLSIFVIYLNSNISIMFIKKNNNYLKKNNLILTIHLYSNVWFLSIFVIYLNSNTSIMFIIKKITSSKKKKKKPTTSLKNYPFLSWNLYIYIYLFFKTFQNFCYPNSMQFSQISIHPHCWVKIAWP